MGPGMGTVVLGGAHGESDRLILKTRDAALAGMHGRSSGGTWDGMGVFRRRSWEFGSVDTQTNV